MKSRPERAAERVIDRLRPRLTRLAAYYARRTGENADDLLQEAWLGVLEALPRLDRTIGAPDQYLIRQAKWRLLDAVKRAARRRFDLLDDRPNAAEVADPAPAALPWLEPFAEALPPTPRAVLEALLDGLTWREAGDRLGCTSANVAYHVRRIRAQYEAWECEAV